MTEWQPIETAPKDGSSILVYFRSSGVEKVSWTAPEWAEDDLEFFMWCVDDNKHGPYPLRGYCDGDDTHWQPLPPPPEGE